MAQQGRAGEAALAYHEASKHSAQSVASNRHFLDFENQPIPFKAYQNLARTPLIRDAPQIDIPALEAISADPTGSRSVDGEERLPSLETLSRVLLLAAGITKRMRHSGGEIYMRAYANTGALHHIDLYLATSELEGLAAGVYHFGVHDFALHCLRTGDHRQVLIDASGGDPEVARGAVLVVSASTYWRNAWKYQSRAYRHCFWDSGTLHANLLATADAVSLEPYIALGFADRAVERLLGLDPAREGALTIVSLGRSSRIPPQVPAFDDLALETARLSSPEVDYPAIREMHAASSLDEAAAARWGGVAGATERLARVGRRQTLRPMRELPKESLDHLIRRRGSTRFFDPSRSISFEALSTILDRATRGTRADFATPRGETLLEHYIIANAVDGLPSGTYHYCRSEGTLALLREGSFRAEAGHLGLNQQLAADAAVNVYSLVDLPPVLAQFSDRGYRAAQLEGGISGGRMYLVAYALGFGATGLTFFDDEVTEFFSPHAAGKSVMFLVALGYADRRRLGLE